MTLSDERLREQAEHVLLGVASGKPDVSDAAKVLAEMVLTSPHGEAGVTVKPLEWERVSVSLHDASALGIGLYRVREIASSGRWDVVAQGHHVGVYDTLVLAKAAAQADYIARIRSALLPTPSVETGRVTDAMRDRLERMRDLARTHAKMTNPPVSHEFQADADALEAALSASPGSSAGADKMWRANLQNAWAAIRMIREAVEEFGPVASLESEDANLLRGPEPVHAAEAIVEALSRVRAALAAAPPQREGLSDQFMEFVDRWTWGNSVTAEEALSCIQHHPILTNWRKRRARTLIKEMEGNG